MHRPLFFHIAVGCLSSDSDAPPQSVLHLSVTVGKLVRLQDDPNYPILQMNNVQYTYVSGSRILQAKM